MRMPYKPAGYCPRCGYRLDPGRCPECGADVPRPLLRRPTVLRRYRIAIVVAGLALLGVAVSARRHGPALAARWWPAAHLATLAQGNGDLAKWARAALFDRRANAVAREELAFAARSQRIATELREAAGHDWAGLYVSPTVQTYIQIAPGGEFTAGTMSAAILDHGAATLVSPDRVCLRPVMGLPADRSLRLAPEYFLVRWGETRLLVPQVHMVRFCNDVNGGLPPGCRQFTRWPGAVSMFELGSGLDRLGAIDGAPGLPPEFARLLLAAPIEARATRVRAWREARAAPEHFIRALVTFDRGRSDGVWLGMRFCSVFAGSWAAAYVFSVGDSTCEAAYISARPLQVNAGDEFTTRSPVHCDITWPAMLDKYEDIVEAEFDPRR